jgi:hypothetical protein
MSNGSHPTLPKWIPIYGEFAFTNIGLTFKGGEQVGTDGTSSPAMGLVLSDQYFGGGKLEATITFTSEDPLAACGIVLFYQPTTQGFIQVQLGGLYLVSLWTWAGGRWIPHSNAGQRSSIEPNKAYHLRVIVAGSSVSVSVDDVNVLTAALPFPLPRGQTGLWLQGKQSVHITNFRAEGSRPKVFVVMQFTQPYNELYSDVIKPVCEKMGLKPERADETFGPGVILQEIEKQILEAQLIIADVTPTNPNVYYEVGYAHALKKPTILIAESPTQLPFDVSSFRVLFYHNTIAGKAKVEAGLISYLESIQQTWLTPTPTVGP